MERDSGIANTDSGKTPKTFTINQNGCSRSSRIGVHDESESVFTLGQNMQPEHATWDDIMYELYVKQKIEEGIKAADEGRAVPHEET